MFRGAYQRKLLTILYSGGSNPLEIWDIQVRNGWTRRVKDEDMGSIVFEIAGTNVATAYIVSPPDPRGSLGITLPFITMFIKNLKRYFTFEIQIMDDKNMRRRFRFSNYQSATKVRPFTCSVPLALKPGWNQMQLNLGNFTTRAYGTNYMETQRVQIHANCRVRRVYFSDRLYGEEELPRDYRVYMNLRQAPPPKSEKGEIPLLKRPSLAEPDAPKEPEKKVSLKGDEPVVIPSGVKDRPSKVSFTINGEITEAGQVMKGTASSEHEEKTSAHTPVDDSRVGEETTTAEVTSELHEVERKGSKASRQSETMAPLAEEDEGMSAVGPDGEISVEIPQVPDEMLTDFPSMPEDISETGEDLGAMGEEGMPEGEAAAWAEETSEHQETPESPQVVDEPGAEEVTETPEVVNPDSSEEKQTDQVERQGSKSSVVQTEVTEGGD